MKRRGAMKTKKKRESEKEQEKMESLESDGRENLRFFFLFLLFFLFPLFILSGTVLQFQETLQCDGELIGAGGAFVRAADSGKSADGLLGREPLYECVYGNQISGASAAEDGLFDFSVFDFDADFAAAHEGTGTVMKAHFTSGS